VCPFKTLEGACNTVIQSMQLGLGVARMEVVDEAAIHSVNQYAKLGLEEAPTLFLEFHGTDVSARNQVELFRQIAEGEGAIRFDWAEKEEDRRKLWKARHDFYWAVKSTYPGKDTFATDICVPISRLAECVVETQEDIKSLGLIAPIAGHAGDGNFHTQPMVDRNNPKDMQAVETFMERLTARAIRMEGTCTGEHGIGQGKRKYLKAELGEGLEVMRAIKGALDPLGIMNPGKILPS
jgi:D-lactate dehydrogenase (cytochrome)